MLRSLPALILAAVLISSFGADAHAQTSPRLDVNVPETDTSTFAGVRHRIGAATDPENRAFINGEEVQVFESGAFVGLAPLEYGENIVELRVQSPAGESTTQRLVVIRPEPQPVLDPSRLLIDEASIQPSGRLWLKAGDVLEVSFRGSPGRQATFEVRGMTSRVPMQERSLEETGGVPGRYVGRYVIQPGDEVSEAPIIIRMRGRAFAANSVRSEARVTVAPYDTPRVVEVVGTRPFLNTGFGTDRLGGARLGNIDAGTRAVVDGRAGGQWRVRLSDGMSAWLPERFAELLPPETPLPNVLVGSISARGDENEDLVETTLAQRIPYTVRHEPGRLVVDLHGAVSNTTWITHLNSAEGIEHVSWEQVGETQYRMFIALSHDGLWGYDVGYVRDTTLRIRVRRPPVIALEDRPLEDLRIVVDAGHGGRNAGAIGAAGTLEKDVTLDIAMRLQRELMRHGAEVIMTRDTDVDLSMGDRFERSIEAWPDLFVSIHANSIGLASDPMAVSGTSTYYRHEVFKPLSDLVYDELLQMDLREFGVIGSFNFSLSWFTQFPNVLVETAFISHPGDEMLLIDPDFQHQMAQRIVAGLERFVLEAGVTN
jgi:N-acetylmuramoyl-L-alanine amidase